MKKSVAAVRPCLVFDILSIVIQAIGGALASKAGSQTPTGDTAPETHLMIAGIIIQLVSMCGFGFLWVFFVWRARSVMRTTKINLLVAATTFSAFCIIVRNFYRAVELSQGREGYLITHEPYFCILDGAIMVLAVVPFNIIHPAWCLNNFSNDDAVNDQPLQEKSPS